MNRMISYYYVKNIFENCFAITMTSIVLNASGGGRYSVKVNLFVWIESGMNSVL